MAVLIRQFKLATGRAQEDRITEQDRIERYMGMFAREDVKKLQDGEKVTIEKDVWQLVS